MADAPAAPPPSSAPAPAAPAATPAAPGQLTPPEGQTPAQARAWTLKVYGQERQVSEDELLRHAQHGAAFRARADELSQKEAAFQRQQADAAARLQKDPLAYFKELGQDPKKWAAQLLLAQAEEGQLSPEQTELRRIRAENEALRQTQQQREETARQAEVRGHADRRMAHLGTTFAAALKEAGAPEGPVGWPLVQEMARYQMELDDMVGRGELTQEEVDAQATPQALAKLAMENARAADVMKWGRLQGPELLSAIPRDVGDRYVEARVLELEASRAGAAGGVQAPAPQAPRGNGTERPRDPETGKYLDRETLAFQQRLGLR